MPSSEQASPAPEPARRLVVVLGYSAGRQRELHPICAARLEHAAGLVVEGDTVLLSGWSRHPSRPPEAELMRRAWAGPETVLLSDPDARHTAQNAANAAAHARDLGVQEVVVVTSSWHRARAQALFRRLLPGVRVAVVGAPTPGSPRNYLREAAVFPLVPLQVRSARRASGRAGPSAAP
ncbi:MAG TPA: YdcF family protein [Gaiellaceae bacterium]|nr:YdcF family protein [Gaiellaceae bacterium]